MKYLAFTFVFWIILLGYSVHGQQKNLVEGTWYDNFSCAGLRSTISYAIAFDSNGNMWVSTNAYHSGSHVPARLKKWNGRSWAYKDPGFDHNITAMVFDENDNLYVGGTFENIGDLEAAYIAMYDGENWHSLGNGLDRTGWHNPEVNSLQFHNGNLYAGGNFDQAGDVDVYNIARWDGSEWSALPGFDMAAGAHVNDMMVLNDVLWMATQNVDYNNGLIRYDLAADNLLDPLISAISGGHHVYSLTAGPDGKVYISGNFTSINEEPINHVAYLDPDDNEFHPMGEGVGFQRIDFVRAHENGDVFVAGNFIEIDSVEARHVARWDGTGWHDLDGGLQGRRNFSNPEQPTSAQVNNLAIGPDGNLYVAGRIMGAGDKIVYRIPRWDGEQWHALGNGLAGNLFSDEQIGFTDALFVSESGKILVGGSAFSYGGKVMRKISAWDPVQESWNALGEGLSGNVRSVYEDEEGTIYVGGSSNLFLGEYSGSRIGRFDGEQWHGVGDGLGGTVATIIKDQDGILYAGGSGTGLSFHRLNGDSWEPVASSMPGANVNALEITPEGDIIIGGGFHSINGDDNFRRVAIWDGEEFHPLANGIQGSGVVNDITFTVLGEPVIAGTFSIDTDEGDNQRVAVFRNGQWQALGEAISAGTINALATGPRGEIFAGGNFRHDSIGDWIHLSVWNGEQWIPLDGDEGLNNRVFDLIFDNEGRLWMGGTFGYAGGISSYRVAMWQGHVEYFGNYRLTIEAQGEGNTDPGIGEHILPAGETVTIDAIPEEGYRLDYWELDGVNLTDNPLSFELDYNTHLKAVFVEDEATSVAYAGDMSNLRVFPNPATDQFNIIHDVTIRKVILSDLSGRIVQHTKVNTTETTLNVSALQNGIYILEVITDKDAQSVKVWVR